MELDWIGASGYIGSTIALGIAGAAAFEWVFKPLMLKVFGSDTRQRRAHAYHDRVFRDASEEGPIMVAYRLIFGLSAMLSFSFVTLSLLRALEGYVQPSEVRAVIASGVGANAVWLGAIMPIALPTLAGLLCFFILSRLLHVLRVTNVCVTFSRSLSYLGAYVAQADISALRSDFATMKNRSDAIELNKRTIALAEKCGHPIPWSEKFYL